MGSAAQAEETYFAHIDANSIVTNVIVADQATINTGRYGKASEWVQTYADGSVRKNYAGIGYFYDKVSDAFIAPRPYASWNLDAMAKRWKAPVPQPTDAKYDWDENTRTWVKSATQAATE